MTTLPQELLRRVDEGKQARDSTFAQWQLGFVRRVWTEVQEFPNGLGVQLAYFADVEVVNQGGGRAIIPECSSAIPVQIGHQVMVSLVSGDSSRGGQIIGFAQPPRPQQVFMQSRDHSQDNGGRGLGISRYGTPTPASYWVINNIRNQTVGTSDLVPMDAQSTYMGAQLAVLGTLTGDLSASFDPPVPPPYRVGVRGQYTPLDIVPSRRFVLTPVTERHVVVTNDQMQFEVEIGFGEIACERVYNVSQNLYDIDGNTADTRVTFALSEDAVAMQFTNRIWVVLQNELNGRKYNGSAVLGDNVIDMLPVTRSHARAVVSNSPTSVRVGDTVIGTGTGLVDEIHAVQYVSRSFGHSWNTLFTDLSREMGNRLRVDVYHQMQIVDRVQANSILADSVRFRGRWKFQMREIGIGSGL